MAAQSQDGSEHFLKKTLKSLSLVESYGECTYNSWCSEKRVKNTVKPEPWYSFAASTDFGHH